MDFDGMESQPSAEPADRDELVGTLNHWLRVTRRLATQAEAYKQAHGFASLLSAATAGQETKLRALWPILQSFASTDPDSDPVSDLPGA